MVQYISFHRGLPSKHGKLWDGCAIFVHNFYISLTVA